jgi:hypothetical protein
MSIYISIPSLEDNDLESTIRDAYLMASRPQDIHIGLALMTDEKYFNRIKDIFSSYKNLTIKRFDPDQNIGVGIGRYNAMSMYSGQDYIMQLDPHTCFEKNWDSFVVNLYKEAVSESKNNKVVLTTYLPAYFRTGEITKTPAYARYPFFQLDNLSGHTDHSNCLHSALPAYTDIPIKEVDVSFFIKRKKFLPSVRFCAHFMFSDKNFYNNTGLFKESVFFEEEIIQSINLIDDGYSLIFPNVKMPLYHMYTLPKDFIAERSRLGVEDLGKNKIDSEKMASSNFIKFIQDPLNKEKIDKYIRYANLDNALRAKKEYFIPKKFSS